MSLVCLQILVPITGLSTNVLVQVISFKYFSKLELLNSEYLRFTLGVLRRIE